MASLALPENMPVGFRFHPTEEELVDHYLKRKLVGDDSVNLIIAEVDVSKVEPWDLPALSKVKSDDPEWFFFTRRCLKYRKSVRSNRATKVGYWKATGKERMIKSKGSNNILGTKRTLVFYTGRSPQGVRTNWVIHEYHAVNFPDSERTFDLCRLKKTSEKAEEGNNALINDKGEPSRHIAYGSEKQNSSDIIPSVNSLPEVNLDSMFEARDDFPSILQEPSVQCQSVPTVDEETVNIIMKFLVENSEEAYNADDARPLDENCEYKNNLIP